MSEWVVRPFREDEWELLRALRLEALANEPTAYGSTVAESLNFPESHWRMMAREWNYVGAFVNGTPVAMGSGGFHDQKPGTTWLFGMYVSPPWRGKGVGDGIVAAVATWARDRGSDALYLHVTSTLPRSRAFYRRLGFSETGDHHGMLRDPSLQLREMHKPLSPFAVAAVASSRLHDLRRRVLRGGLADAVVSDPRDDEPTALHLAGFLDGQVVVSASFYPSQSPTRAEFVTWMLRYMATEPAVQGRGYGAAVLTAGEELLRTKGVQQIWANGRDTALGFYRRLAWETVPGSEHLSPETRLPHTVITKNL